MHSVTRTTSTTASTSYEPTPEVTPETVRAWESLVHQHSSRVYRLAYRLTGNRADAEDITQEVLVRAMRAPDAGTTGTAEGWFHRVTTNLFVDLVRRRRKARTVPIDERPWSREPADTAPDPAEAALDAVLEPDVAAALAALPPAFREAVLLCDVHGLSYAEIGKVIGVKTGTVRTRIHRGRAMLRSELAHRAPSPGRQRHGGPLDEAGDLGTAGPTSPVGTSGTMAG